MKQKVFHLISICLLPVLMGCSHDFNYENPLDPEFVGTISGRITDASNGQGIPGVLIRTYPITKTVDSDANGNYSINNARMGNYTVTAMKTNYYGNSTIATISTAQGTTANIAIDTCEIEMIIIPAGNFIMGSSTSDPFYDSDEIPQHTVYMDSYQISKYEITKVQFKRFIDAGGYKNIYFWSNDGWYWWTNSGLTGPQVNNTNYPVAGISWYEAEAFCTWIGARLPTEAEWEKAARGTNSMNYWPWGSVWDSTKCNNISGYYNNLDAPPDTFANISPVGYFSTDQSPYGVYDMAGNVCEWVSDWYSPVYYSTSPASNPTGPAGSESNWCKIVRGGSFINGQVDCRSTSRSWYYYNFSKTNIGFRIVK